MQRNILGVFCRKPNLLSRTTVRFLGAASACKALVQLFSVAEGCLYCPPKPHSPSTDGNRLGWYPKDDSKGNILVADEVRELWAYLALANWVLQVDGLDESAYWRVVSISGFILWVCLLVWGWNPEERLTWAQRKEQNSFYMQEVNWGTRSEMISMKLKNMVWSEAWEGRSMLLWRHCWQQLKWLCYLQIMEGQWWSPRRYVTKAIQMWVVVEEVLKEKSLQLCFGHKPGQVDTYSLTSFFQSRSPEQTLKKWNSTIHTWVVGKFCSMSSVDDLWQQSESGLSGCVFWIRDSISQVSEPPIQVELLWQGIRFEVTRAGPADNHKVTGSKEKGPPGWSSGA